jgi:hypothetical protein
VKDITQRLRDKKVRRRTARSTAASCEMWRAVDYMPCSWFGRCFETDNYGVNPFRRVSLVLLLGKG